jgi:hypothetical protein
MQSCCKDDDMGDANAEGSPYCFLAAPGNRIGSKPMVKSFEPTANFHFASIRAICSGKLGLA